AKFPENLLRGGSAKVGGDQNRLEVVQGITVYFFGKCQRLVDAFAQVFPRTSNSFLHLFEEGRLRRSKKRLNHELVSAFRRTLDYIGSPLNAETRGVLQRW